MSWSTATNLANIAELASSIAAISDCIVRRNREGARGERAKKISEECQELMQSLESRNNDFMSHELVLVFFEQMTQNLRA